MKFAQYSSYRTNCLHTGPTVSFFPSSFLPFLHLTDSCPLDLAHLGPAKRRCLCFFFERKHTNPSSLILACLVSFPFSYVEQIYYSSRKKRQLANLSAHIHCIYLYDTNLLFQAQSKTFPQ